MPPLSPPPLVAPLGVAPLLPPNALEPPGCAADGSVEVEQAMSGSTELKPLRTPIAKPRTIADHKGSGWPHLSAFAPGSAVPARLALLGLEQAHRQVRPHTGFKMAASADHRALADFDPRFGG